MQFGCFTLSDNSYRANRRNPNQLVVIDDGVQGQPHAEPSASKMASHFSGSNR
jgi:hypothetical protein